MIEATPLPTCPMAETCKGMMAKPFSRVMLFIPGLLLVALGILIVIEPRILVWIVAVVFVLLGGMMIMMAKLIRGISANFGPKPEGQP
jgi:hypothetical protein